LHREGYQPGTSLSFLDRIRPLISGWKDNSVSLLWNALGAITFISAGIFVAVYFVYSAIKWLQTSKTAVLDAENPA